MNGKFDIFICHDRLQDTARLLSSELRFRGYCTYCCYGKEASLSDEGLRGCRYVILVLSDTLFASAEMEDELRTCHDSGAEIIPVCLSNGKRGFPVTMQAEFSDWRSLQVSVISEDDLFEKSVDKLIEDRFAEDFKAGRRITVQSQNGLSLNTLRLVDIIRRDGESLDDCIYRVFDHKIDESRFRDWSTLD